MKKVYFFILILFGFQLNAQILNFPDPNFKNALVNTICSDTDGDIVPDATADTNNDGEIELSEALLVTSLSISNQLLTDVTGLENFSNVMYLNCGGNQLNSLSLAGLSNLSMLYCMGNSMSELNLSGANSLYYLNCSSNNLTDVDFSAAPQLQSINCEYNNFSAINVCGTIVEILWCSNNPNLTYFSIKNNLISDPYILRPASPPPLPSIWYENCPLLTEICIDEGEYQGLTGWGFPSPDINITTSCECTLGTQQFADHFDFAITPNPATNFIALDVPDKATITKIAIYDISGKCVANVSTQTKTIPVDQLTGGVYFIAVDSNNGKTVKKFIKI